MSQRAPRYSPTVDYGPCHILIKGEKQRELSAKVTDESDIGLGFQCLDGAPPNEGDQILVNKEHSFTVLWSKEIQGQNYFGIKL